MITHLFKNFLNDINEYKKSEKFWEDYFKELLKDKNVQFIKRLNYSFADGSEFLDGNPIYDLYIEKDRRGIRIIQEEINHENVEISAWLDKFETELIENNNELVISLELSNESLIIAKDLIINWIINKLSIDNMKVYIDNKLKLPIHA